jgi:transcriptional regulator with XRE-family HTH domain
MIEALATFGRQARRRRLALHLTLPQAAGRVGLSPNFFGSVERGSRDPSLSVALRMAKAVCTHLGDLVGGYGPLSPEALALGRAFDTISDAELRGALLALVEAARLNRQKH